jgi:diguanylate cyclase (GGDEF)-like protein/PAS domain S-box-containing protein
MTEPYCPEPHPAEGGVPDPKQVAFDAAAVGILALAPDLSIIRANESFGRMVGRQAAHLPGLSFIELCVPEENRSGVVRGIVRSSVSGHGGGVEQFTRRLLDRTGRAFWTHLSVSAVHDPAGRLTSYVVVAVDVTERRRSEAELRRRTRQLVELAMRDPLTGLFNHRSMVELFRQRFEEAEYMSTPLSVFMIDLVVFSAINSREGHEAGNRALCHVATCLHGTLRDHDVACRYGGDEFLVILSGVSPASATRVAERVRAEIRDGATVTCGFPVTCSIGIAVSGVHASTPDALLMAADLALYSSKERGRDQVRMYEPHLAELSAPTFDLLLERVQKAGRGAVRALIHSIDLRDQTTGAHSVRVGEIAAQLGERLGCSSTEMDVLRVGAPLLDVGKIAVPRELLVRRGPLSPGELRVVQHHPLWGEMLVRGCRFPRGVREMVRWHHERLDGSGYPDGLHRDEIPHLVRIAAVADIAAALMGPRPYRPARGLRHVHRLLRQEARVRLDPEIVEAFCDLYPQRSGVPTRSAAYRRAR